LSASQQLTSDQVSGMSMATHATAAHHVGLVYHRHILADRPAAQLRDRFLALCRERLPAGGNVLDFGAGTGIDAAFLSGSGHIVHAYEPDPDMRAQLLRHCDAGIAAGAVVVEDAIPMQASLDGAIADFAVLNLIEDRRATFQTLHAALRPGAPLLLSLLNPWCGVALRKRSTWSHALRLVFRGWVKLDAPDGESWRFARRVLAREAAPEFRLVRARPATGGWRTSDFYFAELERV
jgi:SAM-dependent methyltransferase